MTTTAASLEYAHPAAGGICPNCGTRPATAKQLYGHNVCKKCLYGFANRRQVAWLADAILIGIIGAAVGFGIGSAIDATRPDLVDSVVFMVALQLAIGLLFSTIFVLRDGTNGQSLGKMLTGVQVVDARTGQPISFLASFKRNAWYYTGVIPVVGGIANLVLIIVIIIQMTKGPRLGDRFAGTRVIWKKFATSPVFGGPDTRCRACNYDLTGNISGQCPECGAVVPPQTPLAMPA